MVLLTTNKGKAYIWNTTNDYIPPFNHNFFPYNFAINFSFESIRLFKSTKK